MNFCVFNFWSAVIDEFLCFQILKCDHRWIFVLSIFGLRSLMNLRVFNCLSESYFEISWFQNMVWKVPVHLQSVYLSILSKRSFHIVSLYSHATSLLIHCFIFRFMYLFLWYCSSHPKSESSFIIMRYHLCFFWRYYYYDDDNLVLWTKECDIILH